MITKVEYGDIGDRTDVLTLLETKKFSRLIDVGASHNMWAGQLVTHTVDLNEPRSDNTIKQFRGNICESDVWELVAADINQNSVFDFSICTHTLEDILDPQFVVKKLSQISKQGFIAMPSKWVELSYTGRPFKGWIHHRWIFDVIDGYLVCVPKLPYMEHIDTTSFKTKPEEIRIYWEGELPVKILNDDYIGPSEEAYLEMVINFLQQ